MHAFWYFIRQMLRYRARVAVIIMFATLSAGGIGAGLVGLGPLLQMVLDEDKGKSLVTLAQDFNAEDNWVDIPVWIVERLPVDRFDGVVFIIAALLVATTFASVCNFMHLYLSGALSISMTAKIRQQAFRTVVNLPLMTVVSRGPTEFVARIVRDTVELQRGFIALTSKAVSHVAKGAAALVAAFVFDWRLALGACVAGPLLAIVLRKIGKKVRRGTRGSLKAQEGLLRISTESLQGLRSVKANTGERTASLQFRRVNKEVMRQELKVRTARAMSSPAVEGLVIVAVGALAIVATGLIIEGSMSLPNFVLTIGALTVAGASFRPLAGLITEMQAAAAPAQRLLEILGEPSEQPGEARLPALPRHSKSIEFDSVSLTYPGTEQQTLCDVSLTIPWGERVAIVGPNGAGKTTLVSLVPRLVVQNEGKVLIDGTDISGVSLRTLRRQIGLVAQETVLFRGSIADNIAYGMGASVTREQVIDAAVRAHADDFIRRIPGGYDADIAEQGASLSGGQRQRLAIARAILRNPSILILDEATSQIDAESEAQIAAALEAFSRGRTAIIIAHRLATVVNADRIVVMENGTIADQGTHAALLNRCELYRRLTHTQLIASA
jgi:subfamily B ATP-binding cassette protein MsbA